MKLIQVSSWREACHKTGRQVFDAQNEKQAIAMMKKSHPGITPHTCYWHPVKGCENINRFYFVWEGEK